MTYILMLASGFAATSLVLLIFAQDMESWQYLLGVGLFAAAGFLGMAEWVMSRKEK
ncbi:MAG: hypothetical protein KGL63_11550 [Betaproteobacteria bacterium]|nr:hypothetical protein [Betaproteobacteria bacterium]